MARLTLNRVTFTGADAHTDLPRLERLVAHRPWVEVAVLVSKSRAGSEPRYPGRPWRQRFYTSAIPRRQRALHLCGQSVGAFLHDDERLLMELDQVGRVQLNVSLASAPAEWLPLLPEHIRQWQAFAPDTEFVLQANHANAALPGLFTPAEAFWNLSFLVDGSGGRGIAPRRWPAPVPGFRTAYAGGLGPGRIETTLASLSDVTRQATGIDMETGIRTGDHFDLAKVEAVLAELEACCEVREGLLQFRGRPRRA